MRNLIQFVFLLTYATIACAASGVYGEEVWIDGHSFYKSVAHKKESTIYFEEWTSYAVQFLQDEDYFVAMQLHKDFDPLPKDQVVLPSLATLAAMGDAQLRADYFQFLERFGRTNGINHLVLPDTSGFSYLEKEVILQANRVSPFYFLHQSSLSHVIPQSKKSFKKVVANPTIWVIDQKTDTKKLERWSQKENESARESFINHIQKAKHTPFMPAFELSESLARSVFKAGVIAIDPLEIFPLKAESITYLGSDLVLKNRLSQYTKVYDYRVDNVPCVVDARNFNGTVLESDIILQQGEPGDNTTLLLPEITIQNMDIVIAKMIFGARAIIGRSNHPDARRIENYRNLGYTNPSLVGFDTDKLKLIDSLAQEAIEKMATPSIQVSVIKGGDVIAEKSYGYFTYDSIMPVNKQTVYDIASVTKVAATLPAIGLLLDRDLIQLDDSVSKYLPEFIGSNKSGVTIKQLLAHNAGLKSYVPFWKMMMTGDRLDVFYYKTPEDELNDIRSYGLEPHPGMLDSLKSFIVKSNLIKNQDRYHYSDLGFMILHLLIEEVSNQPFDEFLMNNFYTPMGLKDTKFNPVNNGVSRRSIVPTEYDDRYRNYQVWGEVHDRNSLVFGGVSGHAGLFSTATDLAKIMSMFMNDGYFGGRKYLSKETVDLFNQRSFAENRRGLGWDKKDRSKGSVNSLIGDSSFGHTGFTGTMVWADPEHDLIYIFLSNRIYPDANNRKLMELNTREEIHDVIYQAFGQTD